MKHLLVAILLLMLSGCTGWRTAANRSVLGAESLARNAEAFESRHCGEPMDIANKCKAADDLKCSKLFQCQTFAKSLLTFRVAILTAQHALIETGTTKQTAQALALAALKAYGPIAKVVEAWK